MNSKLSPFVSIVIPTYNHANFLGKALESVITQTFTNWEAIVVDNQSTDHTSQVISKFNDHRIKYIKISNYGIIAKSRNHGINVAKGEWIAFLDSDDFWPKEKLNLQIKDLSREYRNRTSAPHFLEGGYRILGIKHNLNTKGYTSEFTLLKEIQS